MKKYKVFFLYLLIASCHTAETNSGGKMTDPIDFAMMDSSIRPQNNFFLYANGNWLKNIQIPASQAG